MRWVAALFASLAMLIAGPVVGQVQFAFEFSFSNPGARSLGLGGAFAAVADDATAAFANPAGLTQLAEPEVSIEGRRWSYSLPFTQSGRASGEPTGVGLDTETGLTQGRSEADLAGLSFVSFVYPGKGWSVAFYRHQLADFEFSSETQGIFFFDPGSEQTFRLADGRNRTNLEIVTFGLAAALQVHEKLSLGMGFAHFEGSQEMRTEVYSWDSDTIGAFFDETSFLAERQQYDFLLAGDGDDWGLSVGFLCRIEERWQVGGSYREGPSLDGEIRFLPGPVYQHPLISPGTLITVAAPVSYPDVYGLGVAFRSRGGRLTASLQWDHVGYSSIFDSIREPPSRDPGFRFGEEIDDGDELHLGVEYAFIEATPLLALRAGVWRDPDHRVKEDPCQSCSAPVPGTETNSEVGVPALFQGGGDDLHYAIGFGAAFDRFQIDVGADFSELVDTVSLSGIYSF